MSDNYYDGVPSISVDDAVEIAELCMIAGRRIGSQSFWAVASRRAK